MNRPIASQMRAVFKPKYPLPDTTRTQNDCMTCTPVSEARILEQKLVVALQLYSSTAPQLHGFSELVKIGGN